MGKYLVTFKKPREREGVERTSVKPAKVHNIKEKKSRSSLASLWDLYPHTVYLQPILKLFVSSSAFKNKKQGFSIFFCFQYILQIYSLYMYL